MSSFCYSSSTSFSSQTLIPCPRKLLRSLPSFPTIDPHQRFSLIDIPKTSRFSIKRFLSTTDFRLAAQLFIHCSNLDSPSPRDETRFLYSFFVEIGLKEKEIKFLLEQNPYLTLTAFDCIRDRVFALESVGIKGVELYRLIIKWPDILIAEEINPFLHFILNGLQGKIEPAQLRRLFAATEPKFLVGFDKKVDLLRCHGVTGEKIVHILNNVNLTKAMCLKSIEEIDRTITFLSRFGGIDIIVRRPTILNFDLYSQLIPRVEFLRELSGGDEEATGAVLRKLPAILSYSVEHTQGHVELLRSFAGLTNPQIFKILLVFPNVISASKERKLHPRIEFLKQCGMNSDEIFKFLTKAPLFLGLSYEENIAHKLVFLVKIGYGYRTKELALALGAVTRTSCENLQKVIGLFFSYGLSSPDILAMSKKHPQVLQYSYDSLQEKMEYLIDGMGREVGELLTFPAFLGYKLDDRIKHRYEAKKKVLGAGMSLNKLLSISADRFSAEKKKKNLVLDRQNK